MTQEGEWLSPFTTARSYKSQSSLMMECYLYNDVSIKHDRRFCIFLHKFMFSITMMESHEKHDHISDLLDLYA